MNNVLQGQTAIVTGGASGIGRAAARALHAAGMKLVLTARREDRLRALAQELGETTWLAGDITDADLPQRLIDQALERFGRCDVVFNNAGLAEIGPLETIDIERVCQMARVNVEAAFRMAYVAMRHFQHTGTGQLVNTSSILGTKVRPGAGAYAGTKYAIEALTEGLRMDAAGSDIRVACIQPGLVMTELHDTWEQHPAKTLGMQHPLQPEDVANTLVWMLTQPPHVRIPKVMVLPGEQQM